MGASLVEVLVIEDDQVLGAQLGELLRLQGYRVRSSPLGECGLAMALTKAPDLILLDVMLPDVNGFSVLRRLREQQQTPVIMLTACGAEEERIRGLRHGADDYLAKPFEPRELLARLRALMRRSAPDPGQDLLQFGRLLIDFAARQARLDNKPCDLTSHQFDLLAVLARASGRVLSRDQIMDALKGHPLEAFDRSIDVHISRIRAVIEDDPKNPRRVLTVRGAGYVFARKQDAVDPGVAAASSPD